MQTLSDDVHEMNQYIQEGRTLEAMEIYYADEVTMQENEDPPRSGKQVCLNHEKFNLSKVQELKASLLRQAIDHDHGIVFSEWEMKFITTSGICYLLTEVSVQQWQNKKIIKEKFYYKDILRTT
jgi:hypothetical protein